VTFCALFIALVAAGTTKASPDNPGAYTDPAPSPLQDEQAASDVRRHLRQSGVPDDLTADEIHAGVVVAPPTRAPQPEKETAKPETAAKSETAPKSETAAKSVPDQQRAKPRQVRLGQTIELTAQGLAPSRRAGLEAPADSTVDGQLALLIGAVAAAAGAGVLAVRRR
jgi:hypothetical protein